MTSRGPAVYDALVARIVQLAESPWDAWPVYPAAGEPVLREAQFGSSGLLQFRVDEPTETLLIINILWTG